MSLYIKTILIIFGLAYLISPVDIIPDLLIPYFGWIDDGVVLWTIYYLIRYGRLPNYFFKQKNPFVNPSSPDAGDKQNSNTQQRQQSFSHKQTHADDFSKKEESSKTSRLKTAWEILDIPKDAGKKEIQNAYKDAIKKYHPDKLSHLGEEFSSLANEKFLEIQVAYDELMKKYN